ncbi:elongation factor P [candidate division WOR-3 bacterium]|uniref:Elongation factor P n=1 Tax=candidate division WOR-3 bacterium TaxID=2052148 RepID=A0A660SEL1_UNCW3|nr:MAG: elongation factor P [candidate division WOR-3 bacterium]
MITAIQIRKGKLIKLNGEPYKVIAFEHITPGKGQALVQTKLRNLITGLATEKRFRPDDRIEEAVVDLIEAEYLYEADGYYHFMNTETFDDLQIRSDVIEEAIPFLIPNIRVKIQVFEGRSIGIELPKSVDLKVVETQPYLKDATAQAQLKPAKLETGFVCRVPPYIEVGDRIRVDTRDGSFIERVKEA